MHPSHLERIDADIRARMMLERGLRRALRRRRMTKLAPLVGADGRPRRRSSRKPTSIAVAQAARIRPRRSARRQVLWGWPHCVQDREITQLAIDKRLTLIAWEAMNHWQSDGGFGLHVFHKNNEIAGYCSVLHALAAVRIDRRLRPPVQCSRHRVRRDRPRRRDRAERPRHPRCARAHQPRHRGRRLAHPVHRHHPVRARPEAPSRAS